MQQYFQQQTTTENEKRCQDDFTFLHNKLLCLLQRQVAIEERLMTQRETIQRITDGFAILRGWASHNAHTNFTLHDILLREAYGSGNVEENCSLENKLGNNNGINNNTSSDKNNHNNNNNNNDNNNNNGYGVVINADVDDGGSGNSGAQCSLQSEGFLFSLRQQKNELQRHIHNARKSVFSSLIRTRVLDEGSAPPDGPTQFHSLTADSFYLFLPHLTEVLQEIVNFAPTENSLITSAFTHYPLTNFVRSTESIPPTSQLPSSSSRLLLLTSAGKQITNAEWCLWLARVLRFIELGLKHFSEVLSSSELRPFLLKFLEFIGEAEETQISGVVDTGRSLRGRALCLCTALRQL